MKKRPFQVDRKILASLVGFGFSEREADIYATLLASGPVSVLQLSKITGHARATLQSALSSMLDARMVSQTVDKKNKLYVPASPEEVKHILKERAARFDDLIPSLRVLQGSDARHTPRMKYVEGLPAVKQLFLDALDCKSEFIYTIDGVSPRKDAYAQFWPTEFRRKRIRTGKKMKCIMPDFPENVAFTKIDVVNPPEYHLLPHRSYAYDSEVWIVDSTVIVASILPGETYAITVESPEIAKVVKALWQISWNSAS